MNNADISHNDRVTLNRRINALTTAKAVHKARVEEARSVLLEAIAQDHASAEYLIQLVIAKVGVMPHQYHLKAVVTGDDISLCITLTDDWQKSTLYRAGAITQFLFQDLGVERLSIGDRRESLRVNYFWCWDAQEWIAEKLEVA